MARLREIMLQRPREPAKVHPTERPQPQFQQTENSLDSLTSVTPLAGTGCVAKHRQQRAVERQAQSKEDEPELEEVSPPSPQQRGGRRSGGGSGIRRSTSMDSLLAETRRARMRLPPPSAAGSGSEARSLLSLRKDAGRGGSRREAVAELPPVRKDRGDRVPTYLRQRQAEAAEERRRAAMPPAPVAPPGYRLVPEEERLSTVEALARERRVAEVSLNSLPFKIETAGQRRREKEAKDRLAHVEKLEAMFNKREVYVPEDAEPLAVMPSRQPPSPKSQMPTLGGGPRSDNSPTRSVGELRRHRSRPSPFLS